MVHEPALFCGVTGGYTMSRSAWRAFALIGTVLLAGTVQAQALKSPNEIQSIFAGNTAYITHANGVKQQAYFETNGQARVTQKSGKKAATWKIDKNTICHDLSTERKCYTVTKKSDDTYQLQSTDYKWTPTYKMVPGNPEKL